MPPFSKTTELTPSHTPVRGSSSQDVHLPGQPELSLSNIHDLKIFLEDDLCSQDLETMAPRLWIMTTALSANINALHRQRVRGREVIITEEPQLHLV